MTIEGPAPNPVTLAQHLKQAQLKTQMPAPKAPQDKLKPLPSIPQGPQDQISMKKMQPGTAASNIQLSGLEPPNLREKLASRQMQVPNDVFFTLSQMGSDEVNTLLDSFQSIESLNILGENHSHPISAIQLEVNGEPYTMHAITGGFLPHQGNWSIQRGLINNPLHEQGGEAVTPVRAPQKQPQSPAPLGMPPRFDIDQVLASAGARVSPEVRQALEQLGDADMVNTLLDHSPGGIQSLDILKQGNEHPVSYAQIRLNGQDYTMHAITGGFLPHQGPWNMQSGLTDDPMGLRR